MNHRFLVRLVLWSLVLMGILAGCSALLGSAHAETTDLVQLSASLTVPSKPRLQVGDKVTLTVTLTASRPVHTKLTLTAPSGPARMDLQLDAGTTTMAFDYTLTAQGPAAIEAARLAEVSGQWEAIQSTRFDLTVFDEVYLPLAGGGPSVGEN